MRLAEPVLRRRQISRQLPGDDPGIGRPSVTVGGETGLGQFSQCGVGLGGIQPRMRVAEIPGSGFQADIVGQFGERTNIADDDGFAKAEGALE